MEERKEVKPINIDFKCPECEKGYLRPTGNVLNSYPPQYSHECNNDNCDYSETFIDKRYPYLIWEEINILK